MSEVIDTYALQILAPEETEATEGSPFSVKQQQARVFADLPARLEAVEEDLSDLLPTGWMVRIRRWDVDA